MPVNEIKTQSPVRTCVYCQVSGPGEHFERIGPSEVTKNWACRQQNLCVLRTMAVGTMTYPDPVSVVLQLVRELAQMHRTDVDSAHSGGTPGGPEWARYANEYQPMLSLQDVARLHVVLRAAAGWLTGSYRAEWSQQLTQARADLGCKQCGAMGPSEPCRTGTGTVARSWHAGRKF